MILGPGGGQAINIGVDPYQRQRLQQLVQSITGARASNTGEAIVKALAMAIMGGMRGQQQRAGQAFAEQRGSGMSMLLAGRPGGVEMNPIPPPGMSPGHPANQTIMDPVAPGSTDALRLAIGKYPGLASDPTFFQMASKMLTKPGQVVSPGSALVGPGGKEIYRNPKAGFTTGQRSKNQQIDAARQHLTGIPRDQVLGFLADLSDNNITKSMVRLAATRKHGEDPDHSHWMTYATGLKQPAGLPAPAPDSPAPQAESGIVSVIRRMFGKTTPPLQQPAGLPGAAPAPPAPQQPGADPGAIPGMMPPPPPAPAPPAPQQPGADPGAIPGMMPPPPAPAPTGPPLNPRTGRHNMTTRAIAHLMMNPDPGAIPGMGAGGPRNFRPDPLMPGETQPIHPPGVRIPAQMAAGGLDLTRNLLGAARRLPEALGEQTGLNAADRNIQEAVAEIRSKGIERQRAARAKIGQAVQTTVGAVRDAAGRLMGKRRSPGEWGGGGAEWETMHPIHREPAPAAAEASVEIQGRPRPISQLTLQEAYGLAERPDYVAELNQAQRDALLRRIRELQGRVKGWQDEISGPAPGAAYGAQ